MAVSAVLAASMSTSPLHRKQLRLSTVNNVKGILVTIPKLMTVPETALQASDRLCCQWCCFDVPPLDPAGVIRSCLSPGIPLSSLLLSVAPSTSLPTTGLCSGANLLPASQLVSGDESSISDTSYNVKQLANQHVPCRWPSSEPIIQTAINGNVLCQY